jgi:hypothetical protein
MDYYFLGKEINSLLNETSLSPRRKANVRKKNLLLNQGVQDAEKERYSFVKIPKSVDDSIKSRRQFLKQTQKTQSSGSEPSDYEWKTFSEERLYDVAIKMYHFANISIYFNRHNPVEVQELYSFIMFNLGNNSLAASFREYTSEKESSARREKLGFLASALQTEKSLVYLAKIVEIYPLLCESGLRIIPRNFEIPEHQGVQSIHIGE